MPRWYEYISQRWPLVTQFALAIDYRHDTIFLGKNMIYSYYAGENFPTAKFINDADALESALISMRPVDRLAIYISPRIGLMIDEIKQNYPRVYAYCRITESCHGNALIAVFADRLIMRFEWQDELRFLGETEKDLAYLEEFRAKCAALRVLPLPIADSVAGYLQPFD